MNLPPRILKQRLIYRDPVVDSEPLTQATPEREKGTERKSTSASSLKFQNVPMAPQEHESESLPVESGSREIQKPFDSLPVLQAFQDFLDLERAKMRKRLVILSVSYVLLLMAIIAGGLFGGMVIIKRFNGNIDKVKGDFQLIQTDIAKLQSQSLKVRADTDTLAARLSAEAVRIRSDLGSSTDDSKNRIQAQVTTQDDKLAKMNELILALQKENASLRNGLAVMQTKWVSVTNGLLTSLAEVKALKSQSLKETVSSPRVAAISSSISIPITPYGQNQPVDFRIPIPE